MSNGQTYTSTIIDDLLQQDLASKSQALQDFQQGILSDEQRAIVDRSLQEQYGIETRPFIDIPEETEQEYYGQAAQAMNIIDPASDFDRYVAQRRVREIYDEYTRSPREQLEEQGIDPTGAPFDVQRDLADLPIDPSVDSQDAAILSLKQIFPGVDAKELDVSVDAGTNEVIFRNPETKQYTTINPVGQNWMDAAGRWMKLEGDAIAASLVPGIALGVGTGVITKSPALAQAAGMAGDVSGYTMFRINNLWDLRERGLLNKEDWTDKKILNQALSDAIPVGIGSMAGVAITRMLTAWIKRLPKMDLNEGELVDVIEKVYEAKGIPFHDTKSAVKYLYEKQLKGELPPNMTGGDVPWEAHPTEKILEMARRVADIESPGAIIRPTTPQVMLEASERLGLDVSGSPGKTAEVLQAALEAIRRSGGPLAQQADEVLSGQEKQMVQKYQQLLDEGLGTEEALKELASLNTKKIAGTGRSLDKLLSERQIAQVDDVTNKMQQLTDDAIETVDDLTANRLSAQESGEAVRGAFETQIKNGEDLIEGFYNALGKQAGGERPLFDPTNLIRAVEGLKTGQRKRIMQSFVKQNSALDDVINMPKLKTPIKDGRTYQKISYNQIKGMIEDVNDALTTKLDPADYKVLSALKKELIDFRSSSLSTIGDDIASMATLIDEGYSVFKETFKKGVINKITKAASGSTSRYALPDSKVMEALLMSGNKFDDDLVRSILKGNTPDADVALRNVQAWLKGNVRELARQPDGVLDPSKITGKQLETFMGRYGKLMQEYLPAKEFKKFSNFKKLIPELRKEIQQYDTVFKQLLRDPEVGQVLDETGRIQLANDPGFFFNKLYGRGTLAKGGQTPVAMTETLRKTLAILKRNNSKASKEILNDLRMYAAKDLDDMITIKDADGLIDPKLFREYITTFEEPLELMFGKKFVKGLGDYERMIRYLMPSGGKQVGAGAEGVQQILTGKQQNMIRVGNDITRAYIGIFTRPGRFLTAFLRTASTKQQKRLLNLMLNPDQITSEYQARQLFGNPYVQMVSRQWAEILGARAGEEGAPAKIESVLEQRLAPELIEEEKIKFFNTGGRVKLMPLRYDL